MITNFNLSEVVSIGITTKNRWRDLQVTLNKIVDAGLTSLPIFIIDDNSDQSCPFDLAKYSLKIELQRFGESQGLIVRRNQLAYMIRTKYYLSLDDDSFPMSGSLQAAIDFAETREDLFCLSFPIYNPILGIHQNKSLQVVPYQVRFFVGCGHLIKLEHFYLLGGYCEELVHQGEEQELAARAFQTGLHCYHFPGYTIHHLVSAAGRNWHRMDYYGSRNMVLWNDWFVPRQQKLVKQSRTLISRFFHTVRVRRLGLLKGEIAGLRDIAHFKSNRNEMSPQLYKQWCSLPEY